MKITKLGHRKLLMKRATGDVSGRKVRKVQFIAEVCVRVGVPAAASTSPVIWAIRSVEAGTQRTSPAAEATGATRHATSATRVPGFIVANSG